MTTYDARITGLSVHETEIEGWGDYAIFAENVDDLYISKAHIHHNGYNGVRTYGCFNAQVHKCHIHHIYGAPGVGADPYFNAYGVTFTRRPTPPVSGDPLTINPPSRDCHASHNHVHDIPTWKALDTHGGKGCVFESNYGYNCYVAIGLDEGDTSGLIDCPFENAKIFGNHFRKGVVTTGGTHRPMGVSVFGRASNPGAGFEIFGNTFDGYGGLSRAQISIGSVFGGKVFGNQLYNSQNAAINFLPELFGEAEVYDNTFYGLSGTILAAIAVQTTTAKASIGKNRHVASDTATYVGVILVAQDAGYYVDLDHQEADDPDTKLYDVSAFLRTRAGNIWTLPFQGNGSPEGVQQGATGMTYINRTGGTGTTFYVKENSSLNNGWVAK